MQAIFLDRFQNTKSATSNLDHLDDALENIAFLTAPIFAKKLLQEAHGKSKTQAESLSRKIGVHAKFAADYARASLASPPHIAFLSGYYSILNLAKIVCLCGPFAASLDDHSRWHGAKYESAKASHGLLTENIRLHKGGALALYYQTLTGNEITKSRLLKLRDIYPLVPGISHEVGVGTDLPDQRVIIKFGAEIENSLATIQATVTHIGGKPFGGPARQIPAIKNFKQVNGQTGLFEAKFKTLKTALADVAREIAQTQFLNYRAPNNYNTAYVQKTNLPLTEAFAAALMFFHLSSVCRYNPEFQEKIMESACWPILLVARRHVLFHMVLDTWSYVNQANFHLVH